MQFSELYYKYISDKSKSLSIIISKGGISMSKIKQTDLKYNMHSWSAQKKIDPLVITTAEGIYFTDEDGKRYADMSSQLVNVNLGHHNEALIAAIKEQADKLAFIGPSYATDVRSEAAKGIADLSGIPGAKVFFTNAGAESNENAIKLAKLYTGKWKILSMQRCYHGSTAGAGGLSGEPRHFANEPGDAGHVHFEGPYPYYAPAEVKFRSEDDVADYYLELLKRVVQTEGAHQIAAIFVESVVGSNGILIPPAKYMQGIRKLCTENNIVMVCDEVMAGFYRTGKPFAFQNFDIQPDLVTFAKGCTCGYVQLGGVIMNKKIAHSFDMTPMQCGLTYSAHPIGCACTCAALREYKEKNIEENVNIVGSLLGSILESMKLRHKCVGDVRYIGLFSGIELVREPHVPLVPFGEDPEGIMSSIIGDLREAGFSTYSHESVIVIAPPLIITSNELREEMKKLDTELNNIDKMI
jgi:4-aminobutyrate aminotransferase and related aminotransferases